jgi:hypothetical protein
MLKEKIKESENALSQKQCKWQNRYFGKSGAVHLGATFSDSQEKAETIAREFIESGIRLKAKGAKDVKFTGVKPPMLLSDYSWHMQIPVLTA